MLYQPCVIDTSLWLMSPEMLVTLYIQDTYPAAHKAILASRAFSSLMQAIATMPGTTLGNVLRAWIVWDRVSLYAVEVLLRDTQYAKGYWSSIGYWHEEYHAKRTAKWFDPGHNDLSWAAIRVRRLSEQEVYTEYARKMENW